MICTLQARKWLTLPFDKLDYTSWRCTSTVQTYLQRHFVPNNGRKASEIMTPIPKNGAYSNLLSMRTHELYIGGEKLIDAVLGKP
jgi:hypothetical protein